jgi:hypothetical protein
MAVVAESARPRRVACPASPAEARCTPRAACAACGRRGSRGADRGAPLLRWWLRPANAMRSGAAGAEWRAHGDSKAEVPCCYCALQQAPPAADTVLQQAPPAAACRRTAPRHGSFPVLPPLGPSTEMPPACSGPSLSESLLAGCPSRCPSHTACPSRCLRLPPHPWPAQPARYSQPEHGLPPRPRMRLLRKGVTGLRGARLSGRPACSCRGRACCAEGWRGRCRVRVPRTGPRCSCCSGTCACGQAGWGAGDGVGDGRQRPRAPPRPDGGPTSGAGCVPARTRVGPGACRPAMQSRDACGCFGERVRHGGCDAKGARVPSLHAMAVAKALRAYCGARGTHGPRGGCMGRRAAADERVRCLLRLGVAVRVAAGCCGWDPVLRVATGTLCARVQVLVRKGLRSAG